jgi:hypothetical protein
MWRLEGTGTVQTGRYLLRTSGFMGAGAGAVFLHIYSFVDFGERAESSSSIFGRIVING